VLKIPWGVRASLLRLSASTGFDVQHGESSQRGAGLSEPFDLFVGIDWASELHRVCVVNPNGDVVDQKWIEHSGQSLSELVAWLRRKTTANPAQIAIAIELPRGPVVETLMEQGFAVFSINPKQLDRFRDRYSPAGAKDDSRDARVLADSLRTDLHCFHAVRLDEPVVIRLRELSRLEDDLGEEQGRLHNQLREQWHRYFPQLLQLSSAADDPWVWDLFQAAPLPARAAQLSKSRIERILRKHRIRRIDAAQVHTILSAMPLTVAPGAAEAASEHALLLLPRLRLLQQQRADLGRKRDEVLKQLQLPDPGSSEPVEHRDAEIVLSLPGIGNQIGATMLSEAQQAIAERDYHALRCFAGAAPITRSSGKKKNVLMRHSCNERLRNAVYHWARVSVVCDPKSKAQYAQMRAKGHSHGRALRGIADRWIAVLISMLTSGTLYDPQRRNT
jgi:transposase